ncbi:pyridoxal phosphate synthase yaaE subunit [Thermoplasmatales archaeon BRNA1]|nr:pyridoxal phosphate synthase yaaE subunit [Thermoplasmatales archaeon BRNA1]
MIGVLALQGAFAEHERCLERLGFEYAEIRKKEHLDVPLDALIIPGGESTVMGKLLADLGMLERLRGTVLSGLSVFGTCAGLIILSSEVEGGKASLGTMDVRTVRNAYGRQLGSFSTVSDFKGLGKIPMRFIRAPFVESVGSDVEVLAEVDGRIVAVRQNRQLATAFHPELTDDLSVHRFFLEDVAGL